MTDQKTQDILEEIENHAEAWKDALHQEFTRNRGAAAGVWGNALGHLVNALRSAEPAEQRLAAFAEAAPMLRAGLVLARELAEPAGVDHDDGKYWAHELRALDRLEADIRAATLGFDLADWRADDAAGVDDLAEPLRLTVEPRSDQILLSAGDGREIMIELQGADLRVLSYNESFESPVMVKIAQSGEIQVETSDYANEVRYRSEEPGM